MGINKTNVSMDGLATRKKNINVQMRTIIAELYGFIRGREYTKSVGNVTYEQLIVAAIDNIQGTAGTSERLPILERVKKIKEDIDKVVTNIKEVQNRDWQNEGDDKVSDLDAAITEE